MSVAPYSFDRTGSIQVCIDGPEVMVYSGDGVPMWKQFLEGICLAVHAASNLVFTVDTDGRFVAFVAHEGTTVVDVPLGVAPVGMVGTRDGRTAVLGPDEVLLVSRDGDSFPLPHSGAVAAAFGGEGQTELAVAGADGVLSVYDVRTAALIQQVNLGQQVIDLAWSSLGRWIALCPQQIFQLAMGEAQGEQGAQLQVLRALPLGGEASQVEVADDGVVCAVLAGDRVIWVTELWSDQRLGSIELHRSIGEISFGLGTMLGIGLEDGEANRANLTLGGTWRTNPGFGRGAGNWPLNAQIDHVRLRTAVVEATAGGRAVAQLVYREGEGSGNGCLYGLVAFFGISLLCGTCTGVAGAFYAMM